MLAALAAPLAGWLGLAGPTPAAAQDMKTMTVSRQVAGTGEMDVLVRYGAGRVRLRPVADGLLYRMELHYDEAHMDPVASFDGRRLELGVASRGRDIRVGRDQEMGSLAVGLARSVPMDLVLELGAVEADLDLGGLSLRRLKLSTGASASTVDVSEPNPQRMSSAELEVGAAEFSVRRLGNLNAERLKVSAGVGEVTLDFSGSWRRDLHVDVGMGLGSLRLRFPEGIGVRLRKSSFLTSIDAEGLNKNGDVYSSPGWEAAERRITIDIDAAFGSIEVVWLR